MVIAVVVVASVAAGEVRRMDRCGNQETPTMTWCKSLLDEAYAGGPGNARAEGERPGDLSVGKDSLIMHQQIKRGATSKQTKNRHWDDQRDQEASEIQCLIGFETMRRAG